MAFGARHMNDNGPFFGLNVYDLLGASAVMIGSSELLRPIHLEFLSLVLAGLSLAVLVPIRLKRRRRILRDSLGYFLGGRVVRTGARR